MSKQQAVGLPRQRASSGWNSLQPELIQNVARFMSPNEVACSLRLVGAASAAALPGPQHTTVRLSQWAPEHAFAAQWDSPGAMRCLTWRSQEKLLQLTGASGSLPNLEVALHRTRCQPSVALAKSAARAGHLHVLRWLQDRGCSGILSVWVLTAAAIGGHLEVCAWLREQGCPFLNGSEFALRGPALAGRQELCAWFLANGCPWTGRAVCTAASAGHVALMNWLLQQRRTAAPGKKGHEELKAGMLIQAAAKGCPLPVLQRLHQDIMEARRRQGSWQEPQMLPQQQQQQEEGDLGMEGVMGREESEGDRRRHKVDVMNTAAASSTPCWRDKVVWLQEEKGYLLTPMACLEVAKHCPTDEEVLARLKWLRERGCVADSNALIEVSTRGHTSCVCYLMTEGGIIDQGVVTVCTEKAAWKGHLTCLQALHAAKPQTIMQLALMEAICGSSLHVVQWLVETPGVEVHLTTEVASKAAWSGSLEVLRYLHERGCPWNVWTFKEAVAHGSEEMREWLRENGCPEK